jgi:hypothetical protein
MQTFHLHIPIYTSYKYVINDNIKTLSAYANPYLMFWHVLNKPLGFVT